MLTVTNRLY